MRATSKLLAVVAFSGSAYLERSCIASDPPDPVVTTAVVLVPVPVVIEVATPRTLESGCPAPGNVTDRAVARPRMLHSGCPAPGNVTARPGPR